MDQAGIRSGAHREPATTWQCGHLALAVLFLIALWLPLLASGVRVAPAAGLGEKRQLAAAPPLDWRHLDTLFRELVPYFNDHFGLREPLVRANNLVGLELFKALPVSKLIVGRDGWLFYNSEKVPDGVTIEDFKGLVPYNTSDLARVTAFLRSQAAWCRRRGIECLFVIVPNKDTLYSEYLPANIRRVGRQTRLDQVNDAIKQLPEVPWLDLGAALRQAKAESRYPLYNRGGTHWNQVGAFYGYHAIITAIGRRHPEITPYEFSDFDVREGPRSSDDHWLGLLENRTFSLSLQSAARNRATSPPAFAKIVVVHDSFWDTLEPFIALHFPVVSSPPKSEHLVQTLAFIERERPSLVIFEVAERYADGWWRQKD